MIKRLIWNFELDPTAPLLISTCEMPDNQGEHWESRFFWPDDEVITLSGLDESFLNLSHYQIKERLDSYYLLPDANYNLKIRRNQLFYKPILTQNHQSVAYGKKINLEEQSTTMPLPGCTEKNAQTLIEHIKSQGITVEVKKEALVHTFETALKTKLEIARLCIAQKTYFSVCIESRSAHLVQLISKKLLGTLPASDYVTFLKNLSVSHENTPADHS